MVSILDSIQTSTHYKYGKRHNSVSSPDAKRSLRTLSISTPINATFKGLKDGNSQLFNQLTPDYNMYYQVTANYSPAKKNRQSNVLELGTSKRKYLKVNKGDTVQLLGYDGSNTNDHSMVYVKLINTLGEGLIPFEILREHRQLNKMVRNHKPFQHRRNSSLQDIENLNPLDFDLNNTKNGESTVCGKYIISNPKTVAPSTASLNYLATPPNTAAIMHLTPPTSPSTLNSSVFSMGCVSRGTAPSNSTSLTLTKDNLPRSISSGQSSDKCMLNNNFSATTFKTPTRNHDTISGKNSDRENSFDSTVHNTLQKNMSTLNNNDVLGSPIHLSRHNTNKNIMDKEAFDMEIPITSCKILSINNLNGRLCYTIDFTNQLNQKLLKRSFYQDFYLLHTQLINYNNNAANKSPRGILLPLPNLPSPTFYSDMDTTNIINERLRQFNEYLDGLVLLIYEFDNMTLKKIWFNWLSQINDIDNENGSDNENTKRNGSRYVSQSNNDKIKIKVLYDGDYHALKTLVINVDTLSKLDTLLRERLDMSDEFIYCITALVDGWYKVNLSNENVYKEVLAKVQDSQRFVLEIREF